MTVRATDSLLMKQTEQHTFIAMKNVKILTDGNVAIFLSKNSRDVVDHIAPVQVNWQTKTITGFDQSKNWWSNGFPCDLLAKLDTLGIQIRDAWTKATVARRFTGTGQFFGTEFDNSVGLENCFVRNTGAFPTAEKTAIGSWENLRNVAEVNAKNWRVSEFTVSEGEDPRNENGPWCFWDSRKVELQEPAVVKNLLVPA